MGKDQSSLETYDYKEVGLKVGIEIHQQLNSKEKLFCRCLSQLQATREPDFLLERYHRPVLGETGKFDAAMLLEFKKNRSVIYEGYYDSCCTYELDETPPFKINQEAMNIAIEIALLLKMDIIKELHICRKNYVDGSVPGGFQRTITLGTNGRIDISNTKAIGVDAIYLEEDAARKMSEEGNSVVFRLDRLGIPLVEITTTPEIYDPEEAKIAAERIGMILRSTNKVKTILGSIRQDLNISIAKGQRIEIKGVQKLDWIPLLVKHEVMRQMKLLEIRDILQKKGVKEKEIDETPILEVTDIFTGCEFKHFKKGIESGEIILAKKFPKFKSLFGYGIQPDRRFGTEIASKVKTITGLQGLIHSDEDLFGKYKFTREQIDELVNKLGIESDDAFIMIIGPKSTIQTAMDIITQRCKYALINVPKETRRAKEDGNTEFLRDLHGGSRLYPDTDSREILVTESMVKNVQDSLKNYQYPWDLITDWAKKYKTSEETIKGFVMGDDFLLIKSLLTEFEDMASIVITTINETYIALRRSEVPVERLQEEHYRMIFKAVKSGAISKDAISVIMKALAENPEATIEEAKKKAGIKDISDSEIENIVQQGVDKNLELIKQRGMGAMGAVMGYVKLQLGEGGFDGKKVSELIKSKIASIAGGSNPQQKQDKKENAAPVEKKTEKKTSEPKKAESNEKKSTESKKDAPNENKNQEQKTKPKKSTNKNGGNQ